MLEFMQRQKYEVDNRYTTSIMICKNKIKQLLQIADAAERKNHFSSPFTISCL